MYTTVSKSHVTECLFTQEVGVLCRNLIHEQHHEQTINAVFEQVRDKPACTSTVDGKILKVEEMYFLIEKTKALISFAVTAKLICAFVSAYAKCWVSHI